MVAWEVGACRSPQQAAGLFGSADGLYSAMPAGAGRPLAFINFPVSGGRLGPAEPRSLGVSEQKQLPACGFSTSGFWPEEPKQSLHSAALWQGSGPAPPGRAPPEPAQSLVALDPLAAGVLLLRQRKDPWARSPFLEGGGGALGFYFPRRAEVSKPGCELSPLAPGTRRGLWSQPARQVFPGPVGRLGIPSLGYSKSTRAGLGW